MSTHTEPAVRVYLARVRTALADLPESEIDEIVDDVRPQLAEIADGIGDRVTVDAMIEHLGTPESYAAEVRAAGDYPPAPPSEHGEDRERRRPWARLTLFGMVLLGAAGAVGADVAFTVWIERNSPGWKSHLLWWLVPVAAVAGLAVLAGRFQVGHRSSARFALWGMLLGAVGAAAVGAGLAGGLEERSLLFLLLVVPVTGLAAGIAARVGTDAVRALPELRWLTEARAGRLRGGVRSSALLHPMWWVLAALFLLLLGVLLVLGSSGGVFAFVALAALGAVGVWAGPRSRRDRRMVWVALPVSAFVVGSGLGVGGYLIDSVRASYLEDPFPAGHHYPDTAGDGLPSPFSGPDQVENLYAFDAEGNPLTEFYLYDQDGAPVLLPRHGCDPHTAERIRAGEDNRFPRPRIEQGVADEFGTVNGYNADVPFCEEVDGVPFAVAVPREGE